MSVIFRAVLIPDCADTNNDGRIGTMSIGFNVELTSLLLHDIIKIVMIEINNNLFILNDI